MAFADMVLPVDPGIPSTEKVAVVMRNRLARMGVEQLVRDHPHAELTVSAGDVGDVTTSSEEITIVVVGLREINDEGRSALAEVIERGVRVLILVGDSELSELGRLFLTEQVAVVRADDLDLVRFGTVIEQLRAGEVPLPAHIARALMPGSAGDPHSVTFRRSVRLTDRERETLPLLADGLSNKQIARRLGLSVHGAKRLVANIMAKFDCPTRAHAAAIAVTEGWRRV